MPIKLNIQSKGKGAGSPNPVPPPVALSQSGTSSASPRSSMPPQVPSSAQQKAPWPGRITQTPTLSLLTTTMPDEPSTASLHSLNPSSSTPKSVPSPTSEPPQQLQQQSHDCEPQAPPYSPITPPAANTPPLMPQSSSTGASPFSAPPKTVTHIPPPVIPPNFASMGGRAPLTHTTHPPVVATAPPPSLEPMDFDDNPDVIALDATIAILLRQKKQAEADLRQLRDAKAAAMERPMAFYDDLMSGRISMGPTQEPTRSETDQDSDDHEDEHQDKNGDTDMKTKQDGAKSMDGLKPSAMGVNVPQKYNGKGKGKATAATTASNSHCNGASAAVATAPAPWRNLPKRQDIVRMPPINWSQYAVEGEALDRLHNKQLTHPTHGTPAVIGANGMYHFTGTANLDDGKRVEGISAPFDPLRDCVEEKSASSATASQKGP